MLLSEYFDDYFYSLKQLAQHAGIAEQTLQDWQTHCLLPNAAYHIKNQFESSSFFGICEFSEQKEYYPRGYTKWITILSKLEQPNSAQAYTYFYQHYAKSLNELVGQGITVSTDYFENLEEQIQNQWQLFLAGKYGVITANGFIHEIVAVELCDYLVSHTELSDEQSAMCIRLLERSLSFPPSELNCASNAHQQLYKLKQADN